MSAKGVLRIAAMLFAASTLLAQQQQQQGQRRGATQAPPPPANSIPCGDDVTGAPLPSIPEIQSSNGVLRGAIYTVTEQQKFTTRGANNSTTQPYCYPQWVRAYRVSPPVNWNPPASQLLEPMPGPTLRARVGDMIELSFLNVIDPKKYGRVDTGKCDQTNVYPGQTGDVYPDCFAGSVITNIHYHGTHTNPNSTGDNVFLEIQPIPRDEKTNTPLFGFEKVYPPFREFFDRCEQQLMNNPGPKEWPRRWEELPQATRTLLTGALKQYAKAWWTADAKQIAQGNFPQFYVGAFPYCYKLPNYGASTANGNAAALTPAVRTPHTHGAGSNELDESEAPTRPLIMGQSPGTHWYHAHKHGSTTINVMNGMTGVFIIEGPYDDEINNYYGANWTKTQPTLVINQLGSAPGMISGTGLGPGSPFSVNGRLQPVITMAGNSVGMWRIANTSARAGALITQPSPASGKPQLQWKQLAQDGVQFSDANYNAQANLNAELLLFPGNRADLLVKAPPFDATPNAPNLYPVIAYNTVDASDRRPARPTVASETLLWVKVTSNAAAAQDFMPHAPSFPSFLSDITDAEITGTKTLTFASQASATAPNPAVRHTIDGHQFDGEVGAAVELNHAEEWKIVNETYPPSTGSQISHPFHIHINPFQLSEVFDPNAVQSHRIGTGSAAIDTNGNVTGSGTAFVTDFRVGDWIWFYGTTPQILPFAPAPAIVTGIIDNNHMTTNLSGKPYASTQYEIAVPVYTIDKANRRPEQCLLDPDDKSTWKPCAPTEPKTNRIWWDVFPIPSGNTFYAAGRATPVNIPGYFKMRSRFVDFSGYYVIHCHILAHEDRGMMTVVEVVPLQTPFSHH